MRRLFALRLAVSRLALAQHDHSAHATAAWSVPLTDGLVKGRAGCAAFSRR